MTPGVAGSSRPTPLHDENHAARRATASSSSTAPSHGRSQSQHRAAASSSSAAAPVIHTVFDPWNSGSTGHQRANNRLSGSTSWRESRNLKLGEQFRGGLSGGARVADTVGAGSEGFGKDGRKANGGWEKGAKGLRAGGQRSLMEVWGAKKGGREDGVGKSVDEDVDMAADIKVQSPSAEAEEHLTTDETPSAPIQTAPPTQIFHNLRFYINGSTAPHISDHKLKHVLAAHGARTSTALGRRTVTHVILGIVNNGHHGGAGGGLAATKIQKEIARTVSKTVKFVTVQW
ncbi:hypothetical protein BDV95DRAFT_479498 [Massariosphaeria phaeospora]|uniref:BRCT domain-containing protein n=1 Tax=Massariosphaeria phaeospora TaxID=100035 RepID=A0A7C8MY73_9PLEO|nr:hypothetical protein BDV95DRAFT_479498 [Massariosphaeria phaeospora]